MSILSDIGTKIGAKIKETLLRVSTLETILSKPTFNIKQYKVGSILSYYRCVVPLCEIDNSNISKFSYTSGRFDFVKINGNESPLNMHVEIKMQKKYNTANPMWYIMHNNLPDNVRPCKFIKNGQEYGGLEIYKDAHENDIYFVGMTTLTELYNTTDIAWEYKDTRDNSIVDTEINNSLEIL